MIFYVLQLLKNFRVNIFYQQRDCHKQTKNRVKPKFEKISFNMREFPQFFNCVEGLTVHKAIIAFLMSPKRRLELI